MKGKINLMKEYISKSAEQTEEIACEAAKQLKSGDVIAFIGGMGAGKTAFTRGLAKGLDVKGEVSSPTFSLVHEYHGNPSLYHFDMYRIESLDDLYSTGYFDYLDMEGIIAVEWSENISDVFDENTIYIHLIKTDNDNERIIKIEGGGRF